ncbi:MAG TPA: hypothetical protein VNQ33_04705 [Acidimicrobiales bacterium]|nr:hypothetical protein [Acidimicrobiales bacterium]
MRAKPGPLALVVIVAVAVAVAVAVTALVVGRSVLRDDPPCAALRQPVAGLDGYDWDNGVTSSGSAWISVLADGTTEADAPSRRQIADAVEVDDAGFDRFRAALPGELEAVADRQRSVAVDPESNRADPAVERDARALARHGMATCNLV